MIFRMSTKILHDEMPKLGRDVEKMSNSYPGISRLRQRGLNGTCLLEMDGEYAVLPKVDGCVCINADLNHKRAQCKWRIWTCH